MASKDYILTNITDKNMNDPQNISFRKCIGKTIYVVNAHFNKSVKEDIFSKIKSLITR